LCLCGSKLFLPFKITTMELQTPKTIEELRKLVQPIREIYAKKPKELSKLDKLACWITDRVGSMGFFIIIFAWTFLWLGWNTLGPVALRFDPYPAFVLWLFLSNMIQIFLMPLIMIGQNQQADHADSRAQADFEVNTKAELEIETILLHLENQNALILKILEHLDKGSNK
jgi:uncharacterized membrane protein